MRVRFLALILASAAALSACTSSSVSNDPKKRLSEYISRSFSVKGIEDRGQLSQYLTGDAKNRLYAWSDEQFLQAFVDSKRQYIKHVYNEVKNLSESEVNITYELTYLDQGKGHDARVTNKKLCRMVLEQGKWLISDVRNIKELVEYRNELSLP